MKEQIADGLTAMSMLTVRAPARLHLGFLDLNADIGRKFGSIGLAIKSHSTSISVTAGEQFAITLHKPNESLKAKLIQLIDVFYGTVGCHIPNAQRSLNIIVDSHITQHSGLGSGTQLALTISTALAKYHCIEISTPELAAKMGRGKRSGIGIATFDRGGFIIDGGVKPKQTVPPVLFTRDFPEHWHIVLICSDNFQGVHGKAETSAFNDLPLFPIDSAREINHITLMQLLPALVEEDIDSFGDAITQIQALIGDHFASAQGGRYSSEAVANCLLESQRLGHKGIAQSSWGPTGCVFVDSEAKADKLIEQLTNHVSDILPATERPTFIKTTANNTGALIETFD